MANIGELTAYLGLDTKGLQGDMMKAQGMFTRFSTTGIKSIVGVTKAIGVMGGAVAAFGATIGGAMLLRSIDKIGTEFEQSMAIVGGVMRATQKEIEALEESARRMGETTEWTASQAADSLKFLGMAGFDANKAMAALPGTLDLATAGNLELGRAADIATNALTAMQLPVEELGRVNDVFVGTITRSNVNMEEMAEAFKYGAPVANAFGYSIEELSGMIGMLGNAGIKGSMAGTQLAMAIQKANEIAGKFGYTSSDLLDVLEDMEKSGMTNADYMQLFGIRAGRAALVLRDAIQPTKDFQQTLGQTSNEAKKLADTMRDTIGGAKKVFASVIESIKIDIFELFRNDLKATIESLTEWLQENRDQIVAYADGIINIFKGIGGAIKAVWDFLPKLPRVNTASIESVKELSMAFDDSAQKSIELADRYDTLKTKTNLNKKEQEELKKVMNDLLELHPDLANAWDDTGKAIGFNTNQLRENLSMQKQIYAMQLEEQIKKQAEAYKEFKSTNVEAIQESLKWWVEEKRIHDSNMKYWFERSKAVREFAKALDEGDNTRATYLLSFVNTVKKYNEALLESRDAHEEIIGLKTKLIERVQSEQSIMRSLSTAFPNLRKETDSYTQALSYLIAELGYIEGTKLLEQLMEFQIGELGIEFDPNSAALPPIELPVEIIPIFDPNSAALPPIELPTIHQEKEVTVTTKTEEDAEDEARKLKTAINAQIDLYENMLSETGLTKKRMQELWDDYYKARVKKINNEADELKVIGISADEVTQYVDKLMRDLGEEEKDFFAPDPDIVNANVQIYKDLLGEAGKTKEQMQTLWDEYKSYRIAQIEAEAEGFKKLGLGAEEISKYVSKLMHDLELEGKDVLGPDVNLINSYIQIYQEMLSETGRTKEQMQAIWDEYEAVRIEQIEAEAEHLRIIGMSAEEISKYVSKLLRDLKREEEEIFDEMGSWLKDFVKNLAQDLRWIMNDLFYDALANDFKKLTDYLEAIWDAFIRRMAMKATDELMDLVGLGTGGVDLTGAIVTGAGQFGGKRVDFVYDEGGTPSYGTPLQEFATGGIVTSPTIAQIGEVPEAIIPLHKVRDEQFMKSIGAETSQSEGDVYVTFNIKTPDVASFRKSEQQLMAQAAMAMRQTRRNM
jgi:hypothetical protein